MWGGRQWRYGSSATCAATIFEVPSTVAHPAGRPMCSDADVGTGRQAGDMECYGSDSDEGEHAFHRACRERYRGRTAAPIVVSIPASGGATESQDPSCSGCTTSAAVGVGAHSSGGGPPSASTSVCSMPLTSESSVSSLDPEVSTVADVAEDAAGGMQVVAPPPPRTALAAAGPRRRVARFRQISDEPNRRPDLRPRQRPMPPKTTAPPQQVARPKRPRPRQQHAQHPITAQAAERNNNNNTCACPPRRPPPKGKAKRNIVN